ncbi:hypothetical protein HYX13_05860 [Candidatus Woesearchaeota archaeon]|nr:hypothetical protein [Candidatus Woesearchaeota archaeon]
MKKTNTQAPWWKLHSGLVIVLAVAVIALAVLSIFRFPTAGQATGLVRVCDLGNPENLDVNPRLQLDVGQVKECAFLLGDGAEEYFLSLTANIDGTVRYDLETQNRDEKIALGLLGPQLTDTRGILVNTEDVVPDVEFHYANGVFEVVNLRAVTPPPATGTLTLHLLRGTEDNDLNKTFTALAQVPVTYSVEILDASGNAVTTIPVTARLKINNQISSILNASSLRSGTSNTFDFIWSPAAVGYQNFTLIGEAQFEPQNLTSQKSYDIAVDGIIYQLSSDPNYPDVTLKLTNEVTREAQVTYVFQNTADKQPFSVPCSGVTALESLQLVPAPQPGSAPPTTSSTAGSLLEVFGFDAQQQRTQGWRAGAPSEFTQLLSHRGYSLKLKDTSTKWMFTLTCTLPEQSELPSLVRGWNLVSITGYKAVAVTELAAKKAPPGTSITASKELQRNDVVSAAEAVSLVPGKSYWVLVQ